MKKRTYRIFKDEAGEWRWNLTSSNGVNIIRCSGEGYKNRKDCRDMMVDDQRGEYFYKIIEITTKDGQEVEEVVLDIKAPPAIPVRLKQTELLIAEKMDELRATKLPQQRDRIWAVINYLKSIQTVLRLTVKK